MTTATSPRDCTSRLRPHIVARMPDSAPARRLRGADGVSAVLSALGGDIDAVLENVRLPAVVLDRDGRIRYLNKQARESFGDIRGHMFLNLIAPEGKMKARVGFAKRLLGTEPVANEEQWLQTHEGVVPVEVHVVAIEAGERVVGVFGIASPRRGAAVSRPVPATSLTPRQAEVLALLAAGRSTAQIADELAISVETVRNHVRGILRALGVRSRLEAVVEALRLGLVAE